MMKTKDGEIGAEAFMRAQITTTLTFIAWDDLYTAKWYSCDRCRFELVLDCYKYCPNCGRRIEDE